VGDTAFSDSMLYTKKRAEQSCPRVAVLHRVRKCCKWGTQTDPRLLGEVGDLD